MVTEAAGTGKPIHVFHLPGESKKFTRFHRAMETRGFTRPFTGTLAQWSYEPLNEAARVAPKIRELVGLSAPVLPLAPLAESR
jgi:mitochondrial fission protein ELM1